MGGIEELLKNIREAIELYLEVEGEEEPFHKGRDVDRDLY
ncbi:type II toxin-antitoxin system HicB family antitoxin [bacterium]|nr:type II toxin-antitoxin system HicB family antitoxin [bacterium]